jgi:hypothetical protein
MMSMEWHGETVPVCSPARSCRSRCHLWWGGFCQAKGPTRAPLARPLALDRFPLLPLEEEGRLNDMPLRENFIDRVFAYYRWTKMLTKRAWALHADVIWEAWGRLGSPQGCPAPHFEAGIDD